MTYKIGRKVEGVVTGIQPYGVFVKLDEETQGLIHISELEHAYVKDIGNLVTLGQSLEVMILDIDEYSGKISLSTRALEDTNIHPFSNRKKNPRYGKRTGSDFDPIDEKLGEWIDDALREINESAE